MSSTSNVLADCEQEFIYFIVKFQNTLHPRRMIRLSELILMTYKCMISFTEERVKNS